MPLPPVMSIGSSQPQQNSVPMRWQHSIRQASSGCACRGQYVVMTAEELASLIADGTV